MLGGVARSPRGGFVPQSDAVYVEGVIYGVSIRNKWMRPFATCPSLLMVFHDDFGAEPHENMPRCTPIGGWNMLSESWLIRRRNVLYNDGHVEFLALKDLLVHSPASDEAYKNPFNNQPYSLMEDHWKWKKLR